MAILKIKDKGVWKEIQAIKGDTGHDVYVGDKSKAPSEAKLIIEPVKGTATGTDIQVTDSANDRVSKLVLDGKSTQETTTGANLIDNKNDDVLKKNGLTFTKNSDGSVTVNGTSTAITWYVLVDKKDYDDGNYYVYVKTTDNNLAFYMDYPMGICTNSKIVSLSSYKQKDISLRILNGITLNNAKIYFMLAKSNIELPYEPYTGGQPSPNPDYPQPISTIENSLKITSCNKNLLVNRLIVEPITQNGVTIIPNKDGTFTINGTADKSMYFNLMIEKKLGAFNLTNIESSVKSLTVNGYTLSASISNGIVHLGHNPSNGIWSIAIPSGAIYDNAVLKAQLEKGTQTTDYEPYTEEVVNIDLKGNELCSLPNGTKDELIVKDGRAKIIKRIGKVILDGSENWKAWPLSATNCERYYLELDGADFRNAKCDKFIYQNNYKDIEHITYSISTNKKPKQIIVCINKSRLVDTTADSFKTWLSTHNTIVQYELETPEEIDLGEVSMLTTYEDVSNITNSEDTNMSIEYDTNKTNLYYQNNGNIIKMNEGS